MSTQIIEFFFLPIFADRAELNEGSLCDFDNNRKKKPTFRENLMISNASTI